MARGQNKNKNQSPPAPKDEPKGLLARAAEAIDHAIHPEAELKSEPEMVEAVHAGVDPAVEGADQAVVQPAKSYHEHMAEWPSKKERGEKPSSKKAERCPTEQDDYEKHPKFSKFKKGVN